MDKEKLREDVISQIRACLISTKGARDLRQIRSDYLMLMGSEIPYRDLGFKNLEQFIRSCPTLRVTQQNGNVLVDAIVSQQTAHIVKFVEKQKTKRKSRPPPRQTGRRQVAPPRWRPRNVSTTWQKSYETPRPSAYAHKQVVSSPNSPPKKPNIKDRLGVRVTPNPSSHFEPPPSQISVQSLRQVLDRISDIPEKPEEITLSKQAKLRLSQKEFPLEEDVNGDLSPLVTPPFTPNYFRWTLPEQGPKMDPTKRFPLDVDVPPNNTTNFIRTGDHYIDLESFVRIHKLGTITCKAMIKENPRRRPVWYCTIDIDGKKYTNYPLDNFTEDSAKQVAAQKALEDLEEFYRSRPQLGLLLSDNTDVVKRVPLMVKEHVYGVWSSLIQEKYVMQYNEQLPLNWIEILNTLPYIAVQQMHDKYVLNYCEPNEKNNLTNPQGHNVSVLPNTVNFNDDGFLIAEITCINSAAEIWCCQRETPEADTFSTMVSGMETYYMINGKYDSASVIQMGGHYVGCNDGLWCRVRVFDVNDDDIHCFCIDFGDEWIIKKEDLYNLKKEYAEVQAQAFVCRLAGLEELYEVSRSSDHLQTLLGKVVQVQQEVNGEDLETNPCDPTLSVVFYDLDTSKPINEEIITYIGLEVASPSLIVNSPTEVYVSHALEDGSVYIQLRSIGYEQLMSLIDKAGQNIIEKKSSINPVKVTKSKCHELYLIQNGDGLWCRVKIIDWSPNHRHAQILYVDSGMSAVVEIDKTDFYNLRDISDVISKFPLQGLLVKLQLKSIPSNFCERIKDLIPPNEPVIVKLIKVDTDYVHIVEFFKMSKTDNVLFSVNLSITPDNEFKSTNGDGNNNNKAQSNKLQRLISLNQFEDVSQKFPSAGVLSCPHIPAVEEYFDVKVSYALHPHSFLVHPYESLEKLKALMAELQEVFKDAPRTSPLQISDILPGHIYASKYEDGKWYRTSVIRVIHSSSISVYYSDYGYYATVSLNQLFPLDGKFLKLPYQAIKAKLGVQPKKAKWYYEDCDYFKNLVGQKCFVSLIIAIEKDALCPSDILLNLKLIDTSQDEDVDIEEVLVQADKAIGR